MIKTTPFEMVFIIRDIMELKEGLISVVKADREGDVYCPICHKILHVEEGQVIPRCCGKVMEMMG